MNNDILNLIKNLSLNDTKTLSQKGLKHNEESGELANKILAYENADGSRHKLALKTDILEEYVDSILVALSIAYSLNYDNDAITSVMHDKSLKWSHNKQQDTGNGKYPYEIHLTLEGWMNHPIDINDFITTCEIIKVKPIILDLNSSPKQFTASSVVYGTLDNVIQTLINLSTNFGIHGYKTIRQKIETVPWNPLANNPDNKNYFESHFTFVSDASEIENIKYYCHMFGVHMSHNMLKCDVDGMKKFMGTIRDHGTFGEHNFRATNILQYLKNNGIVPKKVVSEYVVFDDNKNIDDEWTKNV